METADLARAYVRSLAMYEASEPGCQERKDLAASQKAIIWTVIHRGAYDLSLFQMEVASQVDNDRIVSTLCAITNRIKDMLDK